MINFIAPIRFAVDRETLTESLVAITDIADAVSELAYSPDTGILSWVTYNFAGRATTNSITLSTGGAAISVTGVYPILKQVLKGGSNITITPNDTQQTLTIIAAGGGSTGGGNNYLTSYKDKPTDLTALPDGSVIRVENEQAWFTTEGTDARHGFRISRGVSGNESGVSLVGDKYGAIYTEEGDRLTKDTSPLGRVEVQSRFNADVGVTDYSLNVLIRQSSLPDPSNPPERVAYRIYNNRPAPGDAKTSAELTKGNTVTLESNTYITYMDTEWPSGITLDGYIRFWPVGQIPAEDVDQETGGLFILPEKVLEEFPDPHVNLVGFFFISSTTSTVHFPDSFTSERGTANNYDTGYAAEISTSANNFNYEDLTTSQKKQFPEEGPFIGQLWVSRYNATDPSNDVLYQVFYSRVTGKRYWRQGSIGGNGNIQNATAWAAYPDIRPKIPPGGGRGQALVKKSNTDFDIEWAAGGVGGGLLPSRTTIPTQTKDIDPKATLNLSSGTYYYINNKYNAALTNIGTIESGITNVEFIQINNSVGIIGVEKRASASVLTDGEKWLDKQKTIVLNGVEYGLSAIRVGTTALGAAKTITSIANRDSTFDTNKTINLVTTLGLTTTNLSVELNFKDTEGILAYERSLAVQRFILTKTIPEVAESGTEYFSVTPNAGGTYFNILGTRSGSNWARSDRRTLGRIVPDIDSDIIGIGAISSYGRIVVKRTAKNKFINAKIIRLGFPTEHTLTFYRDYNNYAWLGGSNINLSIFSFANTLAAQIVGRNIWNLKIVLTNGTEIPMRIPAVPEKKAGEYHLVNGVYERLETEEEKTPRRIARLPNTLSENEEVILDADYNVTDSKVAIRPETFKGLAIDGLGYGNRGYVNYPSTSNGSFQYGNAVGLPEHIRILSNSHLVVDDGELQDLASIRLGDTTHALTLVPKTNFKIFDYNQEPLVDFYTIAPELPATGNWNDIILTKSDASTIPADYVVNAGKYKGVDSFVEKADFNAKELGKGRNFKVIVEAQVPDNIELDKNITFEADGTDFINDSFPGYTIMFYNTSTNTEYYKRYGVLLNVGTYTDAKTPIVLKAKNKLFSLSYFETTVDRAVYLTAPVNTADGITAVGDYTSYNIQVKDRTYVGQRTISKHIRTISDEDIKNIANVIPSIHAIPPDPVIGQRARTLNTLSIPNGLVASTTADSNNYTIGFTNNTGTIFSIYSYHNVSGNNVNLRNKTIFVASGTYVPTKVYINGVEYDVTQLSGAYSKYYSLNGLDGTFLKLNTKYLFNARSAQGLIYPDKQIQADVIITYNGYTWETIDALTNIEQFALTDETIKVPFSKLPINILTQAAYDALSVKKEEFYFTT